MVLLQNTAEGGTPGAAVSTANSGGASGDAFTQIVGTVAFSSIAAHGAVGYTTSSASSYPNHSITTSGALATRMYFRCSAAPTASAIVLVNGVGASQAARVFINTAGRLNIQNNAGATVWTATNSLSALGYDTWVRLELVTVAGTTTGNGVIRFAYYAGDSTTPVETFAPTGSNTGTVAPNIARYGRFSGTFSAPIYFDDLAVADQATFIGPVTTAPATGGGAGTWSFAGAGTGARPARGRADAAWSTSGTATGTRPARGRGEGSWSTSGSGTGACSARGRGDGSWSTSGTSDGARPAKGTGSGSWATAGTGTGKRASAGRGEGLLAWAGIGSGIAPPLNPPAAGGGQGAWGFTGVGRGARPARGRGESSTAVSGAGTGRRPATGVGTGAWSTAGTARGARPARGSGSGVATWLGDGRGHRPAAGFGVGTWASGGRGTGQRSATGTGQGSTAWAGIGTGVAPAPRRDFDATWGPLRTASYTPVVATGRSTAGLRPASTAGALSAAATSSSGLRSSTTTTTLESP